MRQAVGATDRYKPATPEQIKRMAEIATKSIRDGAAGIGLGVNYTPGASYEPLFADGDAANHVVAFARGGRVIAMAPRLTFVRQSSGLRRRIPSTRRPMTNSRRSQPSCGMNSCR